MSFLLSSHNLIPILIPFLNSEISWFFLSLLPGPTTLLSICSIFYHLSGTNGRGEQKDNYMGEKKNKGFICFNEDINSKSRRRFFFLESSKRRHQKLFLGGRVGKGLSDETIPLNYTTTSNLTKGGEIGERRRRSQIV